MLDMRIYQPYSPPIIPSDVIDRWCFNDSGNGTLMISGGVLCPNARSPAVIQNALG